MHGIASLATYNFKIFWGAYPRNLLGWLAPSGESGLTSNYAACYALLDACENLRILMRYREDHDQETAPWRPH